MVTSQFPEATAPTASARRGGSRWWPQDAGLLKTSLWSLAIRVAGMVASFAVGVQLARYLGPAGLGTYGVVIATAMILGVAAQAGLPPLATKVGAVALAERDWPRLRRVLSDLPRRVVMVAAILAGLLAMALMAWQGSGARIDREIWWAVGLIPLFGLMALVGAQLRGLDRPVASQSLDTLIRPLLMCVLCLAWIGWHGSLQASEALALTMISCLVALGSGWLILRQATPPEVRTATPGRADGSWFRQGLPLATVDLLKQAEANYALLILGLLAAGSDAGLMRVAISTVILVATPMSVLHTVLAPHFARLHAAGERDELQRLLAWSAAAMTAITAVALAGIAAVGQPLLTFIFGTDYAGAWLPLMLLTVAYLINAVGGCGWVLLAMSGGERALRTSYAVAVPVAIAFALVLGSRWGAGGVAGAAIVSAIVQNWIVWRAVRRQLGLDSSALAVLLLRPARED